MLTTTPDPRKQRQAEPAPDAPHTFTPPELDRLAKEGIARFDEVLTLAENAQRAIGAQTWGPDGPPDPHRLAALAGIAQATAVRLGEDYIAGLTEKLRGGVPPAVRKFIGWCRRDTSKRWRAVVRADTEDEAWGAMLTSVQGGDKCVLPEGQDPHANVPPARR
jgi:hypothetical protein